jgi:hypothetical protein
MPMNHRLLVPRQAGYQSSDADVRAYLAAVKVADGAHLETPVARAIEDFVVGCKADSIWTAIGAACLLAGPRTLAGCLVPLKGPSPTNSNFVSADYNRELGLQGDGVSKRLSSNYNNNTPGQNSFSMSVWKTSALLNDSAIIGAGGVVGGASFLGAIGPGGNGYWVNRYVAPVTTLVANVAGDTGFAGMNRSLSTEFVYRRNGTNTTVAKTSATPLNATIDVFGTSSIAGGANVRLAWYHAGESLTLSLLDARLTTYMAAIAAAIP